MERRRGLVAVRGVLSDGLMHSYEWTFADTALKLAPAWPFVIGYAGMALLFFLAQWITEEGRGTLTVQGQG